MNRIIELEPIEYPRVKPVFQEMSFHLAVEAVLAGCAPGKVYVDDPAHPQAALAWAGRRYYLAGSAGQTGFNIALAHLFEQTVYPRARAAGEAGFNLYYAQRGWEAAIEKSILRATRPIPARREYYTLQQVQYGWREKLPPGFSVRTVDAALLENSRLQYKEDLIQEMCSERASTADFLEKSFGLVLLHKNALAGWCLSEYNCGDRCEIGIATMEPYRRRGLATLMACAFVEQALANGVTRIGWDCFASNIPSGATARRAGFKKLFDYPAYYVWIDPADN